MRERRQITLCYGLESALPTDSGIKRRTIIVASHSLVEAGQLCRGETFLFLIPNRLCLQRGQFYPLIAEASSASMRATYDVVCDATQ